MANCLTCKTELNKGIPSSDCGGDCLKCMADSGDPDCIKAMIVYHTQQIETLVNMLVP